MTPLDAAVNEPEDAGLEYDLAGNSLPSKPKAVAPPPAGPGAFVPPSTGYAPPSGAPPAFARPAAPVKSSPGAGLYFGLGAGLLALWGSSLG